MKTDERENLPDYIEPGVLNPEKLALVHVTKYFPILSEDHFEIPSTAMATDYLHPRNTIHFTVGHHVSSCFGGNWDDKGIMLVAPMSRVVDLNGKPLGMASMDTYFETSPEKRLILPKETHLFMPADKLDDLNGKLFKAEGNKTIYKMSGFTNDEKREIFKDGVYTEGLLYGEDRNELTQESCVQESDAFFALQSKKNMLYHFLNGNGYLTNREFDFGREGSCGANGVCALGQNLGCRFCTSGNKGHYFSNFDPSIVDRLYNDIYWANFILNSDDYSIVGCDDKRYWYDFVKKNQGEKIKVHSANDRKIRDTIEFLKRRNDYSEGLNSLEENAGKKGECLGEMPNEWTPAYRATFHVWKEKTLARLSAYYARTKDFDFEVWQKKLNERISAYEERSFQKEKAVEAQKEIKKSPLPLSVLCNKSR